MTDFKQALRAGGLVGASVLALGLAAVSISPANAAPMLVLPAKSVTPASVIVEAKFRRNRAVRSSRVRRSRAYHGRRIYRSRHGNHAAAMIGAFGAIAAAAIAAESRRDRVVYYQPYAPAYGGYDYYPAYSEDYTYPVYPSYGYGAPVPVYGYGYGYKKRRGLRRIFGGRHRVYRAPAPVYAAPVYRAPRVFRGPRYGHVGPVYGGHRVQRGGPVNGVRRALRRVF